MYSYFFFEASTQIFSYLISNNLLIQKVDNEKWVLQINQLKGWIEQFIKLKKLKTCT